MQAIGCSERRVLGRKDNVVIVNFRRPEPPAPYFPGGGALRAAVVPDNELLGNSYGHHGVQQRFLA